MSDLRCGFDFGTSNSTLGLVRDGQARLLTLEGAAETLPTAVFYGELNRPPTYGRAAVAAYLAGEPGRLMRSIKSALGTALMEQSTEVGGRRVSFPTIIGDFVREAKRRAEADLGGTIDTIVQGRPVRFVDDDEAADAQAQASLEAILKDCGIKHVKFQYEPVAAARHWEATATEEALALVADIGGGTSDFSLIRLAPRHEQRLDRAGDILGNYGVRLGGTDFDRLFSMHRVMPELGMGRKLALKDLIPPQWIYSRLTTWSQINTLYARKNLRDIQWVFENGDDAAFQRLHTVIHEHLGHRVAADVEQAKIDVSSQEQVTIALDYIEPGLATPATVGDLAEAIDSGLARLTASVTECLSRAGVRPEEVDLLVLTGGSTETPLVREAIRKPIPHATVAACNTFGAVGLGLALEAAALR